MLRPSPVILAAIIVTVLLAILALTWGWIRSGPGSGKPAGDPTPEPLSYVKPAINGQYVAVVFGSESAESKLTGDAKKISAAARDYPKSGVYAANQPKLPIWTLDGYAPDECLFLTADGKQVVRLEGDWWKTKIYPAGNRLPADVEAAQLAAPAVSFFSEGKLTRQYTLRELVTNPEKLTHSPEHVLWMSGAVMNENEGRFILFTQDSNRTIFDYRTGEIIAQEKVGLGSRFAQNTLTVVVALMVLVAGIWAYFALIRKRQVVV